MNLYEKINKKTDIKINNLDSVIRVMCEEIERVFDDNSFINKLLHESLNEIEASNYAENIRCVDPSKDTTGAWDQFDPLKPHITLKLKEDVIGIVPTMTIYNKPTEKCLWERVEGTEFSISSKYVASCHGEKQSLYSPFWKYCPLCGSELAHV